MKRPKEVVLSYLRQLWFRFIFICIQTRNLLLYMILVGVQISFYYVRNTLPDKQHVFKNLVRGGLIYCYGQNFFKRLVFWYGFNTLEDRTILLKRLIWINILEFRASKFFLEKFSSQKKRRHRNVSVNVQFSIKKCNILIIKF